MNQLHQLARALGGKIVGQAVRCPGPGHSPKDDSLKVTPMVGVPDGFICHSFADDDWRECRDYVMERIGHRREFKAPTLDNSSRAVELWNSAVDPQQTVRDYHALRGLKLPDNVAGRVVRYHPRCPWRGDDGTIEKKPAMLLAFRSIADDRPMAIHRVLLAPDGRKLGRKMLGPVGGCAIKVDADENVEQGLSIGEGYETCLAGRQLGFRPVWALGSAGAIGTFPVLSGIDALTILGETDATNERAAMACARQWLAAGHEALIVMPGIGGDMNDLLVTP